MFGWIAEEEPTNMNFLEQSGNLEGEDDLEVLEEPPVRVIVAMAPPSRQKEVSMVLNKRKGEEHDHRRKEVDGRRSKDKILKKASKDRREHVNRC